MRRVPDSLRRALSRLRPRLANVLGKARTTIAGIFGRARARIARLRARTVRDFFVIAALAAFTVWACYSTLRYETTDFRRLQRSMNGGSWKQQGLASTSSFDWGAVQHTHLVEDTRALPAPKPDAIPRVQHHFGREDRRAAKLRRQRLGEVRAEFKRAWAAYKKFAWTQDALEPIGARGGEQLSGWAPTLVDSLDSLWIMGLREEFDEAVAAVAGIDFGKSINTRVSISDISNRYLGGLLAAFDLSGRDVLLKKAVELGELIYAGFDTENGMPVHSIDLDRVRSGEGQDLEETVVSAMPGCLSLELTHLSQLTGDPKYYNAVDKVMDLFFEGQQRTSIPGMWPMMVSLSHLDVVTGDEFSLGGNAGSLYQSIPKMHQLLGAGAAKYQNMSLALLKTADEKVIFRPMVLGWKNLLMPGTARPADNNEGRVLEPDLEHTSCFAGGMFGLAGRLFGNGGHVDTGSRLADGCHNAYTSFPAKIMPERFTMVDCKNRDCTWDEAYWRNHVTEHPEYESHFPKGFIAVRDKRYLLRPEAVESVFYMHRLTGESRFPNIAWDMFMAMRNGTRTQHANAAILDVTQGVYPLPHSDLMESWWLSETLKYLYLIFSPPEIISLDDFVISTEGHPFKLLKQR